VKCPEYGQPSTGFSEQSCSRFSSLCGPFVAGASDRCPLKLIAENLKFICKKGSRLEDIARIRTSQRWEYAVGLKHPFELPVHCVWSPFSDYSACTLGWYDID